MSDEHLLDPVVLQRLLRLASPRRPTLLNDLLQSFKMGSTKGVERLREAMATGDREAIRLNAHNLKGACRNLGANALAEIFAALEASPGLATCETALQLVTRELPRVCAALERFARSEVI